MTSPSSSTGGSSARRYLATFAAVTALLLAGLGLLSWSGVTYGFAIRPENISAFRTQMERLENSPAADIVLIGDSSLAEAVDDRYWTEQSDDRVLNLALNGDYGVEGTRNMLRQVLQRYDPQTVVVVQTLDMFARAPSELGDLYTSFGLEEAGLVPLRFWRVYLNLTTVRESLAGLVALITRGETSSAAPTAGEDYERLRPAAMARRVNEAPLSANRFVDRFGPLAEIARLCAARGITCLYAHGPIYVGYCATGQAFIDRIDKGVRRAGLTVVAGTPVCVPASDIGNATDHVAPDVRRTYTDAMRLLVEAELAEEGTPPS